jgi:hypothetical protein
LTQANSVEFDGIKPGSDAARYRWWRDNAYQITEDDAGIQGMAFSRQIDMINTERTMAERT